MMKLYKISKDYHFDPLITDAMKELISSSLDIAQMNSVKADSETCYKLMKLLKNADPTNQGEVVITYEILYNIAEGNTTFMEIVDYIEENELEVSFETLEKFILKSTDSSSYKLAFMKWASNIETIKTVSIDFSSISWNWNNKISFMENINNLFSIFRIDDKKLSIFGNVTTYLKGNNYFFPIYGFSTDGGNYENFLPESLDKYMVRPIYNPTGAAGTTRNERTAVEAYYKKLKNAVKSNYHPELLYKNIEFIDMARILTTNSEEATGLSNSRTYNKGSLLYIPSIRSSMYDNPLFNGLAFEAINLPSENSEKKFQPFLGNTKVDEIFTELLKTAIELIDKRNASCDETISRLRGYLKGYYKMAAEISAQIALEKIGFSKKKYVIYGTEKVSAEKALEYYNDAIDITRTMIRNFRAAKINYFDISGEFMLPEAFLKNYKQAFEHKTRRLETLREWDRMQFYYSIAPFFKYDTSNEKEFMDNFYVDMLTFRDDISTLSKELIAKK